MAQGMPPNEGQGAQVAVAAVIIILGGAVAVCTITATAMDWWLSECLAAGVFVVFAFMAGYVMWYDDKDAEAERKAAEKST